jgi:hypothetical protein
MSTEGKCSCTADVDLWVTEKRVPHEYRIDRATGEYVLVCTQCGELWDHKVTDRVIARVMSHH